MRLPSVLLPSAEEVHKVWMGAVDEIKASLRAELQVFLLIAVPAFTIMIAHTMFCTGSANSEKSS